MFHQLIAEAKCRNFSKLYVETPSLDPEYATVTSYLPLVGFLLETRLADYYERGVDLLVYRFDLSRS